MISIRLSFLFLSSALWVGCVSGPAPKLVAQVSRPASEQPAPRLVLALDADCGSMEFTCPDQYKGTVDNIVRASMDFVGYNLIPEQQVRPETTKRHETHNKSTKSVSTASNETTDGTLEFERTRVRSTTRNEAQSTSTIVLEGSRFEDLSVLDREEVLSQVGADAVLTVRIILGANYGSWSTKQIAEVMVKLSGPDGGMLWASRCAASSENYATLTAALEAATRCAVYGGTGG